jgi:hypothetical protein
MWGGSGLAFDPHLTPNRAITWRQSKGLAGTARHHNLCELTCGLSRTDSTDAALRDISLREYGVVIEGSRYGPTSA